MLKIIKIKLSIIGLALLIFGIIFTSWGLDDVAGLLAHPARAALIFLLLLQFLIFLVLPWAWMFSRLPKQPIDDDNLLIPLMGAMGILLFLMISPFSDRHEWIPLWGGDILRYIGVLCLMLGIFLSVWAYIHIYKTLKIQEKNNLECRLITDGPYKYIRHPRDLGGILIFISIPLVFLSSFGLTIAVISSAGLFERIAREEKILAEQFKEEWQKYAETTKCLIPWA
jgi:protein-S-isoprenylcysteine O-methyltransferase Ste14